MSGIVIYKNGDVELKTTVENETVWLTQKQMSKLFAKSVKTVSEHIGNVFKEGELEKPSVIRNFQTTAADGKTYSVDHYSLDVVISVGYRTSSSKAIKFRKWATQVLKEYLIKGYALNKDKLKQQKLHELEQTRDTLLLKLMSGEVMR